ncbi:hypothetical protein H8959_000206, partial [Pygathrix nigripes]
MSPQKRVKNVKAQNRTSQGSNSFQTTLSAWKVKQGPSNSKNISKHGQNNPVGDYEHADDQAEDALQMAVGYFEKGPIKASQNKDKTLEKHLKTVENVAWKNGLASEEIDILLNIALSGKFGNAVNTRILKCMIPATVISQDSVVKAVSWLCVDKCSGSTKVLFYRWLVAMFDFIDRKEQINLLYGFFFASLQDDALCPYVCHLLYLLTKKENVKPFRVRKLLDLQAKMGMQPHLQALLSLYKFFAPALISVSLPVRKKIYFKNSENLWKMALLAVKQRNRGPSPEPLKLMLGPANVRPLKRCSVLQSLKELLQNWLLWLSMDIHMKPVTNSPLETTLGGSMNSVSKLIHYVGWLSTTAMRLESNSTFLLHFILDFYEKVVCDIYINYNLPLVVLFPPGIFYSALLSLDTSILNQLCFIMHRYRKNLTAAKKNELVQKTKSEFNFSSKTYQEFNHYLTSMVGCLWTSKPFGKGIYIDPEILEKTGVTEYKNSLNVIHHPSFLSYAVSFLLQESPEERTVNMSSIQ